MEPCYSVVNGRTLSADAGWDAALPDIAGCLKGIGMAGFSLGSHGDDPVQIVRMIARISQMLIELRDEYIDQQREDALDQIERRLQELHELGVQLHARRERDDNLE
jgi:predicted RNase H-like HicB family nuclease